MLKAALNVPDDTWDRFKSVMKEFKLQL